MHELSLSGAIVNTVVKHADGRRVTVVSLRVGRLRQVVPDTLEFYFGFVARDTVCEGARLEQEIVEARLRCDARAGTSGRSRSRRSAARRAAAATSAWRAATSSRWSPSRSRRPHASHKGEGRRGGARRQQHDRARPTGPTSTARGVKVVNFMSAPGAGKTTLLERVVATCPACASACSRATCRARWTPTGWPSLHVPVTQLNTDPGFGGECHLDANMVRSALGALPLDEIDLLVIENVGNLVCPAEFRVGEDAPRDGVLGHRGRGQAAQVPADVPHVRPGAGQQDRPAAAPRLRPRPVPLQPRLTSTPTSSGSS